MECHPVCDLFPEMAKQEFAELCEDIAKHGQHTPIWTHEGQIVDGRHRYRACCLLGIAPKFQQWDGKGSLVSFVVSLNLHRRHIAKEHRLDLALRIKEALEDEGRRRKAEAGRRSAPGRPAEKDVADLPQVTQEPWKARIEAARLTGVSARTIQDAEKIKKSDPEAFEAIKRGEKTVHAAKRELERAQGRARQPRVAEMTQEQLDEPDESPVGGHTVMYVPDEPEAFVQPLMTHYGKLWPRFLAAANAATKGARNAG